MSSINNLVPSASNSSLLSSAYPIALPHSMGGNTALYESKGGYVPDKEKATKAPRVPRVSKGTRPPHVGGSKKKRGGSSKKRRTITRSKRSRK